MSVTLPSKLTGHLLSASTVMVCCSSERSCFSVEWEDDLCESATGGQGDAEDRKLGVQGAVATKNFSQLNGSRKNLAANFNLASTVCFYHYFINIIVLLVIQGVNP